MPEAAEHAAEAAKQSRVAELAALTVFGAVGALLGFRTIADPDLGWHLAGGLWMFDNARLPSADPFSTGAAAWVCYSWLFELAVAAVYRVGGFQALRILQSATVAAAAVLGFLLIRALVPTPRASILQLLLYAGLLLLCSPMLYLRPQLLSLLLFGYILYRQDRGDPTASPVRLIFLTVVWANFHVFWIFSPLIVLTYNVARESCARFGRFERTLGPVRLSLAGYRSLGLPAALFFSGVLTPYGTELYRAMASYAFDHSIANAHIAEFHGIAPRDSIYFWAFLSALTIAALSLTQFVREKNVFTSSDAARAALFLLFAAAVWHQVKYLPYFAVTWVLFVARLSRVKLAAGAENRTPAELPSLRYLCATVPACSILLIALLDHSPALESAGAELPAVVAELRAMLPLQPAAEEAVFNDFNSGGWLALRFWEAAQLEGPVPGGVLRTAVDGRTLVMGQQKLAEYFERIAQPYTCQSLPKEQYAILSKGSSYAAYVTSNPCGQQWNARQFKYWNLLWRS